MSFVATTMRRTCGEGAPSAMAIFGTIKQCGAGSSKSSAFMGIKGVRPFSVVENCGMNCREGRIRFQRAMLSGKGMLQAFGRQQRLYAEESRDH